MRNKELKSNKILGLEYMKNLGFNVPNFDFIPDYTDLNLSDIDINLNHQPSIIKDLIEKKMQNFNLYNGISVRSASFDEDNSNQSSAGRYLSFNGLSTLDEITKAVLTIWKHHRLNSNNTKCPLIIQETHPSYFSGVAFKDSENIIIESYYGTCSNIVNGSIKPYITTINNNKIINKYNECNNYTYRYNVHKNIFKENIFEIGKIIHPKVTTYTKNNRFYGFENSKILSIYGNRAKRPINNYEEKIIPQIINILSKLDNKEGVDIEWGSDIEANIYMYQFRKLTRKINNLNLTNNYTELKSNEIIGIPASPGKTRGIITKNFKNITKDSILYIENDNIEDLNLLKDIKGIISVNGGILSHLSIICREMNIPCIVGIEKPVPDKSIVDFDGSTGLISIIK